MTTMDVMVLVGLMIFGIGYASFVRQTAPQGHTALLVVIGVGVVVFGYTALAGWEEGVLLLGCFAVAGLPMVIEYYTRRNGEA